MMSSEGTQSSRHLPHKKMVTGMDAIEMLCYMAWQEVSPYTKKKYMRYALHPDAFKERLAEFYTRGGTELVPNAIKMVFDLISSDDPEEAPAVRTEEDTEEDPLDPANFDAVQWGKFIRGASFAICMLGGEACVGDLDIYMREVTACGDFPGSKEDRKALKSLYRKGDHHLLARALNIFLNQAIDYIEEGYDVFQNHAPAPFIETETSIQLEYKIIYTDYHLISSLLRLVEGTGGSA
jgi:hypothetical protein